MQSSITSFVSVLHRMSAGQRAWFWFCGHDDDSHSRLLLHPFASGDPQSMYDAASKISLPPGVIPAIGIATIGFDGRLNIASMWLTQEDLSYLAEWTRENIERYPLLARLRNTRIHILSDNNQLLESHEDLSLWEGIPTMIVPGTMAEELVRLEKITSVDSVWFWMIDRGPKGQPFLLSREQPSGLDDFVSAVEAIRRRSTTRKNGVFGELERSNDGLLYFYSEAPDAYGRAILRQLCCVYGSHSPELYTARYVQLLSSEELQPRIEISPLEEIRPEKKLYFLFFTSEEEQCGLIIDADKQKILEEKAKNQSVLRSVYGQLRQSSRGWIEFRSKEPFPNFIEELAAFVGRHHEYRPVLRTLKGARFIQWVNGEALDKQKNIQVWREIPAVDLEQGEWR